MNTKDNINYTADTGKFIIRKSDKQIMGTGICLGDDDSISNYSERKYTKKTYADFYNSIGIKNINKKIKK